MMSLTQWLEAEDGRASALAKHCSVTNAAVSQWKTNGVPLHQMRKVARFTNGDVLVSTMIDEALHRAEEARSRPAEVARAA